MRPASPSRLTHLSGVHSDRVSFAIRLAGFYYFFIFALWPLGYYVLGLDAETSRVPGVLLLSMLVTAVTSRARHLNPRVLLATGVFITMFMSTSVGSAAKMVSSLEELLRQWGLATAVFLAAKSRKDSRYLLRAAAGTALFNAAYGAAFLVPPLAWIGSTLLGLGFPSGRDQNATRMIGASSDPNYFGLLLMPGLLYLLHEGLRKKSLVSVPTVCSAFLVLCLLLSFSRSAWLASTVGVFILLRRTHRYAKKTLIVTVPIMVVAIVYGLQDFLQAAISDNEARTTLELENQVDSRSWIWKSYWDLAMDQPFGYGPGSVEVLRLTATMKFLEGSTARPHNVYLILFIERGIQSVLPLVLLILFGLLKSYRISRTSTGRTINELQPVFAIVAASAVGIFSLGGLMQVPLMFVALAFAQERLVPRSALRQTATLRPEKTYL